MSCRWCGAGSHSSASNKCGKKPKSNAVEAAIEEKPSGRGLTIGNNGDLSDLDVCIGRCDHEALFDTGAKSLVGGNKGKPSGLKEKSTRIDRQSEGNVQFQKGGVSLAKVTFTDNNTPQAIFAGLRLSLQTGKTVNL